MNAKHLHPELNSHRGSLNKVPARKPRGTDTDGFPALDAYDAANEYLFEFDLPGLNQAHIQISLDEDALLLVGTRMSPRPEGIGLRVERPVVAFVRRLVLPPDCCGDKMYATLQEGVLQLHVPKDTPYQEKLASHTIQSEEPDYECKH